MQAHEYIPPHTLYTEERDVLEGKVRDLNKSGMISFDALECREKTVAIPGDRWWQGTAKQDGDKIYMLKALVQCMMDT